MKTIFGMGAGAVLRSWLLGMMLLATGQAVADETPTSLTGGQVVSAPDAKKLLDAKTAVFVDTRAPLNFGKGHVPGAMSIAYREKSAKTASFDAAQDQFDMGKLPKDKSKPIVFYSDGPTGWKSYKAAVFAIKEGYKSVHYMRGGWAEWQSKGLPSES